MPGLTGFITSQNSPKNSADLQLMINSMMHEPFYTSGTYTNESLGLYLGWISIKNSFTDCMPIWNEKQDKLLFFHGEDFQDRDVLEQLRYKSHIFRPSSASYLIHLYEDKREAFYNILNGFFSGILVDLASEEISLFNDRFGMQRMYYYQDSDAFYFSSELKALTSVRPDLRTLETESMAELCCMGCVLNGKTLIKDVLLLPGASKWTFKKGFCKKEIYFKREYWEQQFPINKKDDFYIEFRDLFRKILSRYLNSADRITISMTGGLDTRMIMAYNQRPPGALPCHTFGSRYHDSFDIKVARKVARACGENHHIIRVGKGFLDNFPRLAEKAVHISDGYLDVSGATELYVNSLVREIAPIRVTGNYGSEVLRTVRAFKPKPPNEALFDADFAEHIEKAFKRFGESVKMHALSFTLFKQAPWFAYNRLSVEQSQLSTRTPFMDNELLELLYRAPQEVATNDDLSYWLIKQGDNHLDSIVTDRGQNIGPTSSFFGQARKAFYEFLRLSEFAYDYGMPQGFALIDFFIKHLRIERLFLGRHKFYHFRIWYRDELSEYIKGVLLDDRTLNRPYYQKEKIEKMVTSHTRGYQNYTAEITHLLTTELIHRLLLEDL